MESNPYSPPLAPVADAGRLSDASLAPPLWNPNAAANWSLLFTAAFGAWLHARNWEALGEPRRAARSRAWMWAVIAILLAWTLIPLMMPASAAIEAGRRTLGLVLLLAWYFVSAREQARFVKERFGAEYPRLGWGRPLLVALGCLVAVMAVTFAIGFTVAMLSHA
jgi:hypothetical protein